jgi:hypothetical protein
MDFTEAVRREFATPEKQYRNVMGQLILHTAIYLAAAMQAKTS